MKLTSPDRLDSRPSATDHIAAVDAIEFFQLYLGRLQPIDRDALLAELRGDSLTEIAVREGITPAAAHHRLETAKRRFRDAAGPAGMSFCGKISGRA